jgi:hypothetical protein
VELFKKQTGEETSGDIPTGTWEVAYRGPFSKWCVIRPNGTIARQGLAQREMAVLELQQLAAVGVAQREIRQ